MSNLRRWLSSFDGYYAIDHIAPPSFADSVMVPTGTCVTVACELALTSPEEECGPLEIDPHRYSALLKESMQAVGPSNPPETEILVRCQDGFSSAGVEADSYTTVECNDGTWSPLMINCQQDCGEFSSLEPVAAYTIEGSGVHHAATRSISCAEGYSTGAAVSPTQSESRCVDGVWSPTDLICYADCDAFVGGAPLDVSRLALTKGTQRLMTEPQHHGTRLKLRCREEVLYLFQGMRGASMEFVCTDGRWNISDEERSNVGILKCKKACPPIREALALSEEKGYRILNDEEEKWNFHGTQRSVTCRDTFSPDVVAGTNMTIDIITCAEGSWIGRHIHCRAKCPEYEPPDHDAYLVTSHIPASEVYKPKKGRLVSHGTMRRVECRPHRNKEHHSMGYFAANASHLPENPHTGEYFGVVQCLGGTWTALPIRCEKVCPTSIEAFLFDRCVAVHTSVGPLDTGEPCYQAARGNHKDKRECGIKQCESRSPYRILRTIAQRDESTEKLVPPDKQRSALMARKPGDVHLVVCDEKSGYAPVYPNDDGFLSGHTASHDSLVAKVQCEDGH
ncbi:unnamed protein product [Vitrella brassicaformis CCMP3155]|uniref:Sushi domain-containing protein n=1 Tax=Vitrella brassicaformis (strain CCMP3155) TaxID=1169540 RepID=A0A0G4FW34_VITBC|nr:unnamed protein product [Vitrella brassicaformis CCMP3155]|eukprot:CEM19318.1 unnamed protein product [Vitrella brassicaformis CCMP3155]